jgi:hypothetical protein
MAGRFGKGYSTVIRGDYVSAWTRVYPASMKLTEDDHLAVASGAWARYNQFREAFTRRGNQWVEDLSGVRFEAVDVAYLDWLCGGEGFLSERIRSYRGGAGAERFSMDVQSAESFRRRPGWMYSTLGTYLWWKAQRDRDSVESKSGFSAALDETLDDGWYSGRSWGSESRDWTPAKHEVHTFLQSIRKGTTVECHRAGEYTRASTMVVRVRDEKAIELPGEWIPSHGDEGLTFLDRHAWDAVLWAADELRSLYTRIVEDGPLCVPEGEDLGPVAWVYEKVAGIMGHIPSEHEDKALVRLIGTVRQAANACLNAAERIEVPVADDRNDFIDLENFTSPLRRILRRVKDAVRKSEAEQLRRLLHGVWVERVNSDVAICERAYLGW